jgi:predicted Zn-dependent protease
LRPDHPIPLYQLAQVRNARGSSEEAAEMLERVVEQTPDFIAARVLLARLYGKLNRKADFERERAEIDRLMAEEQRLYQEQQKNQPAPQTPERPATKTPPKR